MYNCAQLSIVNTFTVQWPHHRQIDLLENSIQWWHSLHISRISKVCNSDCISKLAGITSLLSPWVARVRRGVINDQIQASDWSVRPNSRLSLAADTWSHFKKRNKETRLTWHLHLMITRIDLKYLDFQIQTTIYWSFVVWWIQPQIKCMQQDIFCAKV